MKTILVTLTALIASGVIAGCERSQISKHIRPSTQKQENFNPEGNSFGKFDCPYTEKELTRFLRAREKAEWPKIKVSATFGGFTISLNNPCRGCENCGCCLGLCIQTARNSLLTHTPLTDDEVNHQWVLFDFIDNPDKNEIILIPDNNVDNGDGYFHIEDNTTFSQDVNDYIGRAIYLKQGSYEIRPAAGYIHGIIVVKTL